MNNEINEELIERVSKAIATAMYNDPHVFENSMWQAIYSDVSQISINSLKTLKVGDTIGDLVVIPSKPTEMMSKTFAKNEQVGGAFEDNYAAMIAAAIEFKE